jgi:membrane-bound serine protease (ClpP class)
MKSVSAIRRECLRRLARRASGVLFCLSGILLLGAAQPGAESPETVVPQEAATAVSSAENLPAAEAPAEPPAAQPPASQPPVANGAAKPEDAAPEAVHAKAARLIRVPLPIVGNADTQVIAAARNAIAAMPAGAQRPVLVLEFSSPDKQTGQGSDFERSLKLARFLSSREASGMETVAYIPEALKGHAVLAAMACESIVMGPEAVLGDAGLDEPAEQVTDPTVRSGYREIANRRRTVPAEVALAMLDKNLELLKVETEVSPEYVLAQELDTLKQKHAIQSQKVLSPPGEFMLLTGSEARTEGFAKYLAANRAELARALSVPASQLQDDPSLWGDWRPIQIVIEGPITPSLVSRVERTIQKEIRERQVNLVILRIDSLGGSLVDSLRLAHVIAELDSSRVQTIAYVPARALSDAAMVALAADQLVMHHEALLGGEGDEEFSAEDLELARQSLRESLAPLKHRSWSMVAALYDPGVRVFEYTHREDGSRAYFSPQERGEQPLPDDWIQGPELTGDTRPLQLGGDRAVELGLARHAVQSFAEFKQQYGLEGEVQLAELGWADYLIQALAAPTVAWLLLLIGGAALYAELQSPGIGIGAFIAGVAFLLYFWSKFLGGTADWLEVLLFTAGVCCVLLELFVLPGTGVFGGGGGVLIIASLILASQTFVVPHNEYQMAELRDSLLGLFAVGVGIGVLAMLMQRYLPHTPLLNTMMLDPPSGAELEDLSHRESLVEFDHLLGAHGVAATQLTPSGKARFGLQLVDVIASGEVIARGEPIVVTEVHGNRVVVRSQPHHS